MVKLHVLRGVAVLIQIILSVSKCVKEGREEWRNAMQQDNSQEILIRWRTIRRPLHLLPSSVLLATTVLMVVP